MKSSPFPCLVVLALLLLPAACKRPAAGPSAGAPAGPRAIPVVAAEAKLQAVSESIALVGSVAANEFVELKAEADGIVQDIRFEEGQDVQRDQLLVQLDDTRFATALAEAEAGFKLSEATYARSRQLYDDKLVSLQEFDQAAATFARNRATVDRLKRELRDARILAPFAGVVGARAISPGQVISRNTVLTTLVDLDPVKVEFYVPERFLSQAQTGQAIEITVAAFPGRRFQGEVYFVAPSLDVATRKALVKARLPNPRRELRPGMFANLELTLTLRAQAVVVPEIALMFDGDQARVFVLEAAGTNTVAALRRIRTGLRLPGLVEVVEGVQAGERVVAEGTQKLVPGARVVAGAPAGAVAPPAAGVGTNPAPVLPAAK